MPKTSNLQFKAGGWDGTDKELRQRTDKELSLLLQGVFSRLSAEHVPPSGERLGHVGLRGCAHDSCAL
eukprot:1159324-Pelagomonas_calceolata.AAC.1